MTVLAILVLLALLAALIFSGYALHRFVIRPNRKTLAYRMSKDFDKEKVVRQQLLVDLMCVESDTAAAVNGLGALVLSPNRLWFHHSDSLVTLDIPLSTITECTLVPRHLGKSTGRPLLMVRYTTAAGPDSAAFHLPYPDEWRLALDNLRNPISS
ncbi:hypothetical protein [Antrihabitans spumae]|jgi:hypothetical protein|uniref:Uncharacterized protein n=1 Tax=Antrihabitans spumae TaxID=3373370 RepID=A0ABW7JS50_9NOCA